MENKNGIDITKELKKREVTLKLKRAWYSAKKFCSENKEWVLGVGLPFAGAAIGGAIKHHNKHAQVKAMDHLKNRMIYDNRNGLYFETKRNMTNSERLEYSRRRDNGEHTADILRDMRILK